MHPYDPPWLHPTAAEERAETAAQERIASVLADASRLRDALFAALAIANDIGPSNDGLMTPLFVGYDLEGVRRTLADMLLDVAGARAEAMAMRVRREMEGAAP